MNKKGFSLTEMLLTVGIAGVVAALTIPTLMSNTQNAQIGPKLAKFVASFEQATAQMLSDNEFSKLSDFGFANTNIGQEAFEEELSNYLKATKLSWFDASFSGSRTPCMVEGWWGGTSMRLADGVEFSFKYISPLPSNTSTNPHNMLYGPYVFVDINGAKSKPNAWGTDGFAFVLYEDGSLRPVGGTDWREDKTSECVWTRYCPVNEIPSCPAACTGHIFENNLKVLYK